ncbi:MAG: hypothetical protein HC905_25205 [Bacteroidales bacterium]|nr:hypothetical protein [Bacteroidales bacterium]
MTDSSISKKVIWRCPSNIAIVKYWGKHGEQLPNNPSLSITLQNAFTETSVSYEYDEFQDSVFAKFLFGQNRNEAFEHRVNKFLHRVQPQLPYLKNLKLTIESKNTFPPFGWHSIFCFSFWFSGIMFMQYRRAN